MPIEWVNFLSVLLLSPEKFEWAKQFVKSKVWGYIVQASDSKTHKNFAIPEQPISFTAPSCLMQNEDAQSKIATPASTRSVVGTSASSTSVVHIVKKRKDKRPLVETEVRRSNRLLELHQGFKKTCMDKNCLPCHAEPPQVSTKVVKNLVSSFCKANISEGKGATQREGTKKQKTGRQAAASMHSLKENKEKSNAKS